MNIKEAQKQILDALDGMDIDTIDSDKTPRAEGLLLSFEGYAKEGYETEVHIFGLYVSKKILNKQTQTIYQLLDLIAQKIIEYAAETLDCEDAIQIKTVKPFSFENGLLEYRIGISVK